MAMSTHMLLTSSVATGLMCNRGKEVVQMQLGANPAGGQSDVPAPFCLPGVFLPVGFTPAPASKSMALPNAASAALAAFEATALPFFEAFFA